MSELAVAAWRAKLLRSEPHIVTRTIVIGEQEKKNAEAAHKKQIAQHKSVIRDLEQQNAALHARVLQLTAAVIPEEFRFTSITISRVLEAVTEHFGLGIHDLIGPSRAIKATWPRQIAMFLCTKLTAQSSTNIGRKIGGRDHSTVIHGYKKVEARRAVDAALDQTLQELEISIRGHQ